MAGHAARLMFHQQYYVAVICIDLPSDIFCILDVTNLITDAFYASFSKIVGMSPLRFLAREQNNSLLESMIYV